MWDSNSDSSEDSNLAALERMREDAFSHSPDDWSEERRKLESDFRREQIQKAVFQMFVIVFIGFGMYSVWTRTSAHHWLPGVTSRLLTWGLDAIALLSTVLVLGFTVWMVAHKLRNPDDGTLSWGLITLWVLLLVGCCYMGWSGQWPPDCDVSDCYDGP
jgi:hypothetical protein